MKKFEMYRAKYNMIHTVLPWQGWILCCFVAKSVQVQSMLFCRDLRTFHVGKIKPKNWSV